MPGIDFEMSVRQSRYILLFNFIVIPSSRTSDKFFFNLFFVTYSAYFQYCHKQCFSYMVNKIHSILFVFDWRSKLWQCSSGWKTLTWTNCNLKSATAVVLVQIILQLRGRARFRRETFCRLVLFRLNFEF